MVLVDLSTGGRHVLAGGGSTLWELLTSGRPMPGAIEELERAYPGSGAEEEATWLIEQLVDLGLLEAMTTSR